jgi:hypothetical protein
MPSYILVPFAGSADERAMRCAEKQRIPTTTFPVGCAEASACERKNAVTFFRTEENSTKNPQSFEVLFVQVLARCSAVVPVLGQSRTKVVAPII